MTYLYISEVGGVTPTAWEIVSFRSCVRAGWLPGGIRAQMRGGSFPCSLWARRVFPFPCVGVFPFPHVKSKWDRMIIEVNSKWNQSEIENQSGIEMKSKWTWSEIDVWNRSEFEMNSKWNRIDPPHPPPPQPPNSYPTLVGLIGIYMCVCVWMFFLNTFWVIVNRI